MSSSPDLLPGFGRHLSLSWHFLNFKALRISRLFLWRKLLSLDLLEQRVPFPAWTGLSISNTEGSGTGPIQGDLRALVYLLGVSIFRGFDLDGAMPQGEAAGRGWLRADRTYGHSL